MRKLCPDGHIRNSSPPKSKIMDGVPLRIISWRESIPNIPKQSRFAPIANAKMYSATGTARSRDTLLHAGSAASRSCFATSACMRTIIRISIATGMHGSFPAGRLPAIASGHAASCLSKKFEEETKMALYTICFASTGGITVEANSITEAEKLFENYDIQDRLGEILVQNGVDITEIYEDPDAE